MHSCLSDVQWLTLSKQGVQTLFYSPLCSLTSFVFCSKTALFKCINSFIYLCSKQINNKAGVSLRVPEQRACCRLLRAPVSSLHWNSLHFDAWLHGENKHINTAACHCVVHQKLWFDTDLRTLLPAADVSMLRLLFLVLANDAESHYSVVHSNLQLSLGCTDIQVHQLWSSFHYSAADFQRNNHFNDYANLLPISYVVLNILSAAKQ